ncbi:membrane-spanning 4-domains subfamily A member 5-like isoform X2 [Varanus komodoensis]|uniref:membrane-spanning 4-domains subfamily A member 5-like isoform X2 n=1 Tax=Varanus komodoensis TaxID=61221 RepID=UPI001CF78080|nr:membrane-spanning 4-domains subfamily A member 5-like isoform X2 [Varanus komodoensis]
MELLTPSACYSRSAPPGNAPGTITVVVPSNNATAQEEKKTYPRKNEALGAVQIIIALIHVALGIILLFSAKEFSPLAMNIYYPFWGGGLFLCSGILASLAATNPIEGLAAASRVLNTFSGLGALAGTIILILDLRKRSLLPITLACRRISNLAYYCKVIKAYESGIVYMMLSFTLLEMWTASSTLIHSDHEQNSFAEVHNHEWEVLATLQIHHLASSQRTFAALFKIDFNKVLMMLMPPTF